MEEPTKPFSHVWCSLHPFCNCWVLQSQRFFNGWGGGTRTHEMLESNSSALAAWRRPNIKAHVYREVHVVFDMRYKWHLISQQSTQLVRPSPYPYNTRNIFIHQWQLVCAIGSDPITSSRRTFDSVLTLPCRFIDWVGICLPTTFREHSDVIHIELFNIPLYKTCSALSPTRTVNLCYTRISALHRETD